MADNKKPLLNKEYIENCKGCQIERRKAQDPHIPWHHFFFIWVITLTAGKLLNSLYLELIFLFAFP